MRFGRLVWLMLLLLPLLSLADEPAREKGAFARFHGFSADGELALVSLHNHAGGLREFRVLSTEDGSRRETIPVEQNDDSPDAVPKKLADRFLQPGVESLVAPQGRAAIYSQIKHHSDRDVRSAYGFRLAFLTVRFLLHDATGPTALASFNLGTSARAEQAADMTRTYWTPDGIGYAVVGYVHAADPAPGWSLDQAVALAGRLRPPFRPLNREALGTTLFELAQDYFKKRLYQDAAYNFIAAAALRPQLAESRFNAARCYALIGDKRRCLKQLQALAASPAPEAKKLLLKVKKHKDFVRLCHDPDFTSELSRLLGSQ